MKTVTALILVLLSVLAPPALAEDGPWFLRFGGGAALVDMSDFNAGIEQMNEIMRNSYRRELRPQLPGWTDAALENEVDAAVRGHTLDEFGNGLSFFLAIGREFGDNVSFGVEIERIIGANEIVHNPNVAMSYDAPATFFKLVGEARLRSEERLSFGVGGAAGWAQATGFLEMPVRDPAPGLENAFLSGNGLLVEGLLAPYYELSEGVDLYGAVGYRLAKLSESDQTWFRETDGGTPPEDVIDVDTSIPLRLDYSGLFARLGLRVDWP